MWRTAQLLIIPGKPLGTRLIPELLIQQLGIASQEGLGSRDVALRVDVLQIPPPAVTVRMPVTSEHWSERWRYFHEGHELCKEWVSLNKLVFPILPRQGKLPFKNTKYTTGTCSYFFEKTEMTLLWAL